MVAEAQGLPTDGQKLFEIRHMLGLSQVQLAERLGISVRALQDLERSAEPLRASYALAVEMISFQDAVKHGQPMLATPQVRRLATEWHRLMFEG